MPGSQCCLNVSREFQRKHLLFHDVNPGRFCYSQWRLPLGVMLIYRFVLAAYCAFWLIYICEKSSTIYSWTEISIFCFLTTWTYILLTVYLMLHLLCCLLYACCRDRGGDVRLWKSLTNENHRRLFHELQVQPSRWTKEEYVPSRENEEDPTEVSMLAPGTPSFLMKIVWILYNMASVFCIMVTVIFWAAIYPSMTADGPMSEIMLLETIQLHAITSVIIIVEHVMSAIPIRLFHYVYSLIYGLIYVTFSGILYSVDHRYVLYRRLLDWRYPGYTAIFVVVLALVGLPLIQLVLFGWYILRMKLFSKCNQEEL